MIEPNYTLDKFKLRHQWVRSSGLPVDLQGIRLRGTKGHWAPSVYAAAEVYCKHFCANERPLGKGLLLVGPPGRGKTTLAAAVFQELLLTAPAVRLGHEPERGRSHSQPGAFFSYARLLALKQEVIQADRTGAYTEEVLDASNKISAASGLLPGRHNARLLVLDDIGKEHSTSSRWAEDFLDLTLRTREAEGWPTIATTNVEPRDWAETYGESMGSFMHQAFFILEMDSRGRRDLRVTA